MVPTSRNERNWRGVATAGGVVLASLILLCVIGRYLLPEQPDIPRQETHESIPKGYHPGGSKCEEAKLATLPSRKRIAEADRCNDAREQHRVDQENLLRQARSAEVAEWGLRLTYKQALAGFVQALATVAAFIAAMWAAWAASRAAVYAKTAAEETRKGAEAANNSVSATITGQRPWLEIINLNAIGLLIDASGPRMHISFELKNVGQTPATDVVVAAALNALPVADKSVYGAYIKASENIKANRIETYPTAIFPKRSMKTYFLVQGIDDWSRVIESGTYFTIQVCVIATYMYGDGKGMTALGSTVTIFESPEVPVAVDSYNEAAMAVFPGFTVAT